MRPSVLVRVVHVPAGHRDTERAERVLPLIPRSRFRKVRGSDG